MNIGALWRKGKGKGGSLWHKSKGKGLSGKAKGKGKGLHWNFHAKAKGEAGKGKDFEKGEGKEKGKGKSFGPQLCWTCGRPGHLSNACPNRRVDALEETEALQDLPWLAEESENFVYFDDNVCEDPWVAWGTWSVNALWVQELS